MMVVQTKSKFKGLYQINLNPKKVSNRRSEMINLSLHWDKKLGGVRSLISQAFIDNVDGVGKPYLVVIMHGSSSWDKHEKLAPTLFNLLFIIYNNFLVVSTLLMRLTTI